MQWSLIVILTTTLVMGMIFGVAGGLRGWEIETKTISNQGIWRSIANAGIVGLAGGIIGGILFDPAFWSLEARNAIVAGGAGVAFELLFGLILGGVVKLAYVILAYALSYTTKI
ncbi:hypothetical protein IQ230_02615 [Gloeocapsopsis crepidinum LEGE 06123]|uniref:Uncharacterized protein n=1 Tax=Gloeocapsopsis crepidinum LEGE 06123 TaxID=588587 RepID=A0ABR9UPI3_9CHRO|nr:hypothetical protein [Gloeocapsopsis crepidinum]MBE9189278.1 hypothetical protein [Gloeocapsopsis crepidinum LEGE 06123]